MRKVILLLFLCHAASAVTHSLKYFYTASSGIPNFPEFVSLGVLDGQQMDYYDSNIKKVIPKQDWMAKSEGPEYWETQTQASIGDEQSFRGNIETAKKRFNQTGGVHLYQRMYGCEWDDETGEVKGYEQFGYDGEDFVTFDLKTQTWIAPKQQAVITKHKWDRSKVDYEKHYLTQECVDWLKKYVNYGRSSLMKTELPSVSLLQKSPSSPVSCHATGFYPDRALMLWRKDGEDLHEDVDQGEILPNHDGSFQMSVNLSLSSVKPEDWRRYDCVFQLSGVKEEIITKLDKAEIRSNSEKHSDMTTTIIITAVVVLALVLTAVIGFMFYKRRGESQTQKNPDSSAADVKRPLTQGSETSSGGSGSSTENLKSNTSELDALSFNSSSSAGSEGSDAPLITAKNDNLKRRGNPALDVDSSDPHHHRCSHHSCCHHRWCWILPLQKEEW